MDNSLLFFYIIGTFAVIAAFIASFLFFTRFTFSFRRKIFYIFISLSVYVPIAQYLKYCSLHMYADISHWMQLLHSITTTGKPFCLSQEFLVPGSINYFSAHFVPFIYLFAPFFKIHSDFETVIFLNYLLMISAAYPLYRLASFYSNNKDFPLLMVVLLLFYPTFQYIVLYEFEMLRFCIPLFLWMLYFWVTRKRYLFFIFAVLAVLVREDVGLTVMMFGIYAIIFEKRRLDGLLTALLGIMGFMIITQYVMPLMRTGNGYEHVAAGFFRDFGTSPGEVLINIARHPIKVLQTIFQSIKLANVFMLFLPLMFVPLLAPSVLVVMAANFGVGFLSQSTTHLSYMLYYVSPSIPFIFYAFIKAWPRLLKLLQALTKIFSLNQDTDVNPAAMMGVLSALLVANIFFGPSFLSLQFWFRDLRPAPFRTHNYHYSAYIVTEHHGMVEEFCELIPDSAIVSAEQSLAPRLFKKNGTMVFPQLESLDGKVKADYVFIDKKNPIKTGISAVPGSWDGLRDNPQYYYDMVEKYPETWELVKSQDGYFLYKRRPDTSQDES